MNRADNPALQAPLPPASARSLLLTVVGEFAFPHDDAVWTTALIRVLGGLGVETHAARQAIARSADAGWITSERVGRAVRWRLTEHGRAVIEDGLHHTAEYLRPPEPWDGRWLILLVTVPQQERTTRKRLYGGLSWLRLGNPTPGLWVTPHVGAVADLRTLIARFDLTGSAISFVGSTQDVGLSDAQIVEKAWNLSDLAERYRMFLEQFSERRPADGDEALFAYLQLRNLLQRFMRLDPQLPEELLPGWIGHEAAALFRACQERWHNAAWARWKAIFDEAAPGPVGRSM
ncbi:PaaX family transcriptional regulator [Amycolatopsis thermoflava]|uniref:PaaX family transcriptional regulator n=1 Tax=Amycolatopsis thermoflava TaxID=84480 RepID=UPI003800A45C